MRLPPNYSLPLCLTVCVSIAAAAVRDTVGHTFGPMMSESDHAPSAYFIDDNYFDAYQPHHHYCNLTTSTTTTHPTDTIPIGDEYRYNNPLSLPPSQSTPSGVHPFPPMASYSQEQVETICTSLFQARDGDRLVSFFKQIGQPEGWRSEQIVVAYIYALYHASEFELLFNILSTRHFSPQHFNDLQEIWHNARYKESQMKRGKELNPVEKYRLRRKYPPPKTIWDGEETVYSFKENSRRYLKQFYKHNQYPTQEQKREISKMTGLKIIQISNWFKNRRQRDKPPSKGSPESSSSSTIGCADFPQIISPQTFNMATAYNLPIGMFYESTRDV